MIAWLLSPLGRAAMVALALFAWTAYQRDQAATKARAECQAEMNAKTIAEIVRQRDAAKTALKMAQDRATASAERIKEMETEADAANQLAKKDGDLDCRIPKSAIERLRNIR